MDTTSANADSGPSSPGRRSFFKRLSQLLTGLWAAGFAAGIITFIKAPRRLLTGAERTVEVGPLQEFLPGQGRLVTGSHQPFWVIRAANQEIVALPAVCTHFHCILEWEEKSSRLICPCHLGAFDLNGNVLSGPPPRPLQPLTATVKGGKIYVYQ